MKFDFVYSNNQEYLDVAITSEIRFVDVDYELLKLREKCSEYGVPFSFIVCSQLVMLPNRKISPPYQLM